MSTPATQRPNIIFIVADDLGFASEAGLHRAFQQATGQTPLAYRMAHG